MAKEIQALATPASTVYAQVLRASDGKIWNTAGSPAFENYATANIGNYDVALTQQGTASDIFCGDFPATIPAGKYTVIVRIRAGGAPAEADAVIGAGEIHWTGTAVAGIPIAAANQARALTVDAAGLVGLAADALDAIPTTEPVGVAGTFREKILQVWCLFFRPAKYDRVANTIKTYAADGVTLRTTQTATNIAAIESKGNAG